MKLSKLDAYGQAIGNSAGCFTYLGVVVVAFAISTQSFKLLERLVLNHLYGPNAWANGLHVVDKHGTLSNGGDIPYPAGPTSSFISARFLSRLFALSVPISFSATSGCG